MGLSRGRRKPTRQRITPRTSEELEELSNRYTPAQLAAIRAGESAVDLEDLKNQARVRRDAWSLRYIDDLSTVEPVIDLPRRAPYSNTDPFAREKTDDEEDDEILEWIDKSSEAELEDFDNFKKFSAGVRHTVGKRKRSRISA